MHHLSLCVLFVGLVVVPGSALPAGQGPDSATCIPDYYWRDYVKGIIPQDALNATHNGKCRSFIGNVPMMDGTEIGQIYSGYDDMAVASEKILHKNKFIKILCTRHPSKFAWLMVNDLSIEITGRHLVVGGSESVEDAPLYIGRVSHGGIRLGSIRKRSSKRNHQYGDYDDSVGKDSYSLSVLYNGEQLKFEEFEVLTYDETVCDPTDNVLSP